MIKKRNKRTYLAYSLIYQVSDRPISMLFFFVINLKTIITFTNLCTFYKSLTT